MAAVYPPDCAPAESPSPTGGIQVPPGPSRPTLSCADRCMATQTCTLPLVARRDDGDADQAPSAHVHVLVHEGPGRRVDAPAVARGRDERVPRVVRADEI